MRSQREQTWLCPCVCPPFIFDLNRMESENAIAGPEAIVYF